MIEIKKIILSLHFIFPLTRFKGQDKNGKSLNSKEYRKHGELDVKSNFLSFTDVMHIHLQRNKDQLNKNNR